MNSPHPKLVAAGVLALIVVYAVGITWLVLAGPWNLWKTAVLIAGAGCVLQAVGTAGRWRARRGERRRR